MITPRAKAVIFSAALLWATLGIYNSQAEKPILTLPKLPTFQVSLPDSVPGISGGDLVSTIKRVKPSVVKISVPGSVGSGFVWRSPNLILTNAHVVKAGKELEVTLTGGETRKAQLIGSNADADVAVIQVEGSILPILEMGDSTAAQQGESVFAIGSPINLQDSVTTGIVSGFRKEGVTFVQTDAAINPGNSGGPLFDRQGQVIGMNTKVPTLKLRGSEGSTMAHGIALAIAINDVVVAADKLVENQGKK